MLSGAPGFKLPRWEGGSVSEGGAEGGGDSEGRVDSDGGCDFESEGGVEEGGQLLGARRLKADSDWTRKWGGG